MSTEEVEGWDNPEKPTKEWGVLRRPESGRLWAYPSDVAQYIINRQPDEWEWVCTMDNWDDTVRLLRLANHDANLTLKER